MKNCSMMSKKPSKTY